MEQETKQINEKQVERFEPKIESSLIKSLNKLLGTPNTSISEEAALNRESVLAMCPANVCMVVAKTERAKRVLSRFINPGLEDKQPELNYTDTKAGEIKATYSNEYLLAIMNVIKSLKDIHEKTTFKINNDYPLTAENDDFSFILAPRVGND